MTFANKYDSKEAEKRIREFWDKENIYKFDEKTKKPIFSIDTPPPTISGKMHIGHAFSFAQTDFVARYKRMNEFEVFYPFGTDDNGMPTEKLVQKEKKIDLRKVTREEAIKTTMEYLDEARPAFISDFKNIGLSCDFNLSYSSISPYSQTISQNTFLELAKKGLAYRKEGPVPWDRVFQTPIAQAELEDLERKAFLNYVKAKFEGTENTYMIYATTRPELCFAVVGMSVEDEGEYVKLKVGDEYWITGAATYAEKFANFEYEIVETLQGQDIIGEKVKIPVVNRIVEISHDVAVKADFGTGIAYFCTYGGLEDIEWAARHNVEPVELLNVYGKLNEKGAKYEGMLAENARKEIIKDMESEGNIIFKEEKTQIVNVGERSGAEVEFIVSTQWYIKYLDKKEFFWERAQELNWFPDHMKHRVENWIKGLNWDWGFTRQRHFGIPIPVWYCEKCDKEYFATENQLPVDPTQDKCPVEKCECGHNKFRGDTDVFDTWFTSASTPQLAINLVKDEETRKKLFPMSLRPQGHDIINFWLFYTLAKTNLIYDKNPWSDAAISGWVLDPQGKKMSKSKGNTIAPQEVVEKYSNDALRFAASSTKLGQDIPYPEKEVKTGLSVANKIFNANKFASMLLENFKAEDREFNFNELKSIDKWIIAKLQSTIKTSTEGFEKYDYSKARAQFTEYFMGGVADNYIEIVKTRLWNPDQFGEDTKKAQKALYYALYNSLKGLAPFMPYITEEVYQNFYKQFEETSSIHITNYPKYNKELDNEEIITLGNQFVEIVSQVRRYKSEKQISMKEELEKIEITCNNKLKEFIEDSIEDLKAVTSAKEIIFKEGDFSVKIN